MERLHDDAVLDGPGHTHATPPPLTPPRLAAASPSPPAPPRPVAVRRLPLGGSPSPVDESDPEAPSRPASPGVVCSQYRIYRWEENEAQNRNSRYPTPPDAPRKDQYIPPSDSESEGSNQSPLRQPPAKIFRNGILHIYKKYKGPVPLTYVNTAGVSRREQRLLRGLHPSRFGLGAPP